MGIKKVGAAIEANTREPLLLGMLIHLAVAAGAVVCLALLMVSRAERRRIETAARMLDASYPGVDGLEYQQAIREEWTR
ncbi:hypothetical protein ADM96_11930 [Burkholderia sp. ST111]|nr:hypothetical protein ADM96_11930 [Burkholderia sp. ST111]